MTKSMSDVLQFINGCIKQAEQLIMYLRIERLYRPEYGVDGGIEMEFVMKRIRKANEN